MGPRRPKQQLPNLPAAGMAPGPSCYDFHSPNCEVNFFEVVKFEARLSLSMSIEKEDIILVIKVCKAPLFSDLRSHSPSLVPPSVLLLFR